MQLIPSVLELNRAYLSPSQMAPSLDQHLLKLRIGGQQWIQGFNEDLL